MSYYFEKDIITFSTDCNPGSQVDAKGTLRSLLRETGLTIDEFKKLL